MNTLAAKLRTQAEAMQKTIDDKLRDRQTNTPKRQKEAMSARIDGWHLQRVQHALETMATAAEVGQLPAGYEKVKKAELLTIFRRRTGSNNYYDIHETSVYCSVEPKSIEFREWVESMKSVDGETKDRERTRKKEIEAMEMKLKFSNIPGYFPTPAAVVETMLEHAGVENGMAVLEPSAGSGNIIEGLLQRGVEECMIVAIEKNNSLVDLLGKKFPNLMTLIRGDFMEELVPANHFATFDRIIMNPPFENLQDIDHVRRAYDWLRPGGRIVAIMGTGTLFRKDKKAEAFRDWLRPLKTTIAILPAGSFKESGTGVTSQLYVINKPE